MSTIPFPQIVGPTYSLASVNADCQRCMNMFLEKIESGDGENEYYLRETPGLLEWFNAETTELPTDAIDGDNLHLPLTVQAMHKCANGRVFFIMRNRLFEIDSDKVVTSRGNLSTGNTLHKFRMMDNAQILGIMADFTVATVDIGGYGLASLTFATNGFHNLNYNRPSFLGTKFIGFMDQYFLTTVATWSVAENKVLLGTQFQISPLNMGGETAWSAVDVFGVESSPDKLTGLCINGREAWLFGPESYEVFCNTGDLVRPFQRIRDAAYAIGCNAPDSILSFQGRVFWLGASKEGFGIVWMSEGYQAVRISTNAIEKLISDLSSTDDAVAWTYQIAGHAVYVISFPTARASFGYDLVTGFWHELSYRTPETGVITQHRAQCQMFAFNKNLVGDFEKGIIYELDEATYTDNLAPIVRYRRAPVTRSGRKEIFFHRIDIHAEVGVGLPGTGDGSDPHMSVRFSDDNAKTWKSYYRRALGKTGEYAKPIQINRLGSTRTGRVFEFYMNEPVPFRITGADLDVSVGVN